MMCIRIFTLCILILCQLQTIGQVYNVGQTNIVFNDLARDKRKISTDIFYPAITAAQNGAIAGPSNQQFPLVIFAHGFAINNVAYQPIVNSLVAQGYIVAMPRTEGNFSPNQINYAMDLAFLVNAIQGQSLLNGNLLSGKVSRKTCIMGHNMGGGCALLAASLNKNIATFVLLAPAETNPSAIDAATRINAPVLTITAGNDCVVPLTNNALPMYNALTSNCKMLLNINGGSHCQFANYNENCNEAELACLTPKINRQQQHSITMRYVLLWLDFRLKGNCNAYFMLMDEANNQTEIESKYTCANAVVCVSPAGRIANDIGPNTAMLKWKANACAATYELRYKNTASLQWISLGTIGAVTNYMLTGLTPGSSYDWSLRTICDDDATTISAWGTKKTFTTATAQHLGYNAENKQEVSFDINPNPSAGKFLLSANITALKPINIYVYSSIGKRVREVSLMPKETEISYAIDLNTEASGIYFVRINYGDVIDTHRIIKR